MRKSIAGLNAAALVLIAVVGTAEAAPVNALTVVIPRVDIAASSSPQVVDHLNLITWETYDSFSGSSLDTGLWRQLAGGEGSVTTGATGLTLTPLSLSDPGESDLGIRATLPVVVGGYFAMRVPFVITNAVTALTGYVTLNIDLCGPVTELQCDSLWVQGNDVVPPPPAPPIPFSGKAFAADNNLDVFTILPTTVLKGQLAIIYMDDWFTNFVDDGSGWKQIGPAFSRPANWTVRAD